MKPLNAEMPIVTSSMDWTLDRITALDKTELKQLLANATRLGATDTAALCESVLATRPRTGSGIKKARILAPNGVPLVARSKAFELRDVYIESARYSWGGVRKADKSVVLMLWAARVESRGLENRYLLWAPNVEGSRPWSDSKGGIERLAHCKLALERGKAEGILVYGTELEGELPESRAKTIDGADPRTILPLDIELQGEEYWAVWGKRAEATPHS